MSNILFFRRLITRFLDNTSRRRVVGSACVALVCSTALLAMGAQRMVQAHTALSQTNYAKEELSLRQSDIAHEAERTKEVEALFADAQSLKLNAENWSERRFNLKNELLSRDAVNVLLNEMRQSADHISGVESFEISVNHPEDGIFTPASGVNNELNVTLVGVLLFRAQSGR